jgi:hypothetical protein
MLLSIIGKRLILPTPPTTLVLVFCQAKLSIQEEAESALTLI